MLRRLFPLLALLPLATPSPVSAQVRRCVLDDGTTVFTDQRCDVIGATERPTSGASTAQLRSYRPACPRTLRDLAFEVSSAVESHDVNRLAGVYLWTGMGTHAGYALMDRLQAVVDRPLVDVQPIWPGVDDEPYPTTVPTRPPVGLRLEQTSKRGSTPVRTVFALRKQLDCWWIVEGGARRAPAPSSEPVEVVD
ncbi:hypothetical protein [Cognatilysobacter segetis]|uniref:hypothetical protein n=1 Tax=Cognatilysobacter segetis TaxID=2492394 RepID=UPI00105D841A|nr:hypothetical protein [Lysobacter segetis]